MAEVSPADAAELDQLAAELRELRRPDWVARGLTSLMVGALLVLIVAVGVTL